MLMLYCMTQMREFCTMFRRNSMTATHSLLRSREFTSSALATSFQHSVTRQYTSTFKLAMKLPWQKIWVLTTLPLPKWKRRVSQSTRTSRYCNNPRSPLVHAQLMKFRTVHCMHWSYMCTVVACTHWKHTVLKWWLLKSWAFQMMWSELQCAQNAFLLIYVIYSIIQYFTVDHINWRKLLHKPFPSNQQGSPIMLCIVHTVHDVQSQNVLAKKVVTGL